MNDSSFSNWSKLGLGTGRLTSIGRGTTAADVHRIVSWMGECGATVIDTADSYTSGRSEELLGQALQGRRDGFVLVTKSGYRYGDLPSPLRRLNPFIKKIHQKLNSASCHDASYLVHHLNRSLQRLRTDHVDCFLLHDPPLEAVLDPRVQESLLAAKQAGKARHIGVSSGETAVLEAAIDSKCYTVIQSPGNPVTVPVLAPIWSRAERERIHTMANHVFFSGTNPNLPLPEGMSVHEYLMRTISGHFTSGTILVGTKSEQHFKEAIRWASQPFPAN
jgi:aryl-alcohol dehydrogenase-like predicted oxidoreductase